MGLGLDSVRATRNRVRPPLDLVTGATACYSDRLLRSAYVANKAKHVIRASDSTGLDIGFTAYGMPNTAAEAAFCNLTQCNRDIFYDQCGSNNLVQATDANRTVDLAACKNGYYCTQATAATQTLVGGANITPATGVVSLVGLIQRVVGGTGVCTILKENGTGNRMRTGSGPSTFDVVGGTSGSFTATQTNGAWHSAIGIINGASSSLVIDGVPTAGTAVGSVTAGAPGLVGAASTTCSWLELIVYDNVALTPTQYGILAASQRIFAGL